MHPSAVTVLLILMLFVGFAVGFDKGHALAVRACTAPATVITK